MIVLYISLGIFLAAGTVGFVYVLHEANMIPFVSKSKKKRK